MNKTLMTVALLGALGLVAYVAIAQPAAAAAPVAQAPAADSDPEWWEVALDIGLGWLEGDGSGGDAEPWEPLSVA